MRVFEQARRRVAQWIAPPKPKRERPRKAKQATPPRTVQVVRAARMYSMAKNSRLTVGWGQSVTSEDAELSSSLRTARSRSRELVRDSAYAKRAKIIVVNNVIGTGIGMQAQVMTTRDTLADGINDDIERMCEEHGRPEYFHTGGQLSEFEFERQLVGQVFEAGEVFVREHYAPFGGSKVPYALELIEPERIADELQPDAMAMGSSGVRLGIELDQFLRPVSYLIKQLHPGDLRIIPGQTDRVERVPASQIIHLRIIDRWPQTRGMPWLHAVARRLNDMDGLGEAEIVAARGAANIMAAIETTDGSFSGQEVQEDGSHQYTLEPGSMPKLAPGEKLAPFIPNRPNNAFEGFMRFMLREVAAGIGCSYESLSKDYSQSNYSSSRLALLDDRDLWRMLQKWFICQYKHRVHRSRLRMAVMTRAVAIPIEQYATNPEKFEAVRFKPRGWSWIDPKSEVDSYREAEAAGYMTKTQIIAQTANGLDLEDVLKERKRELELIEQAGLEFDADKKAKEPAAPEQPAADQKVDDDDERFLQLVGA